MLVSNLRQSSIIVVISLLILILISPTFQFASISIISHASASSQSLSASSPWVAVGPRTIAGSGIQTVPGNDGAGKINSLSTSTSNLKLIYAASGAGPGNSGPYSDGGAFVTKDGGAHWTAIDKGLTDHHVSAVLMNSASSSTVLAGTWFSGIFRTTNGGSSWSRTSTIPASDFLQVGTKVFAASSAGILSSTNFGSTWTLNDATSSPVRVLVASSNGLTLYAGLDNGGIMVSTNGGTSWTLKSTFTGTTIWSLAVSPASPSTVYAVAWTGSYTSMDLWISTNTGATWSQVGGLEDIQVVAVDPSNANVIYAMGDFTSWESTNGGSSFAALSFPVDVRFIWVDPLSSSTVFVGSDQGAYESIDSGAIWSSINGNLANSLLTAGSVSSDGKTFISAVQDYSPIVSLNTGSSWAISSSAVGEDGDALINQVASSHAYIMTISGLFTSSNGGTTFSQVSSVPIGLSPGPLCDPNAISVDNSNPQDVYVATTNGIYKSTDYGVTFTQSTLPGQAVTAVTVLGSVIYAATASALSYSTSGGSTWSTSLTSLPNIATIAIDPLSSSTVFVGNPSGLFKSTNGGANFATVTGLKLGTVLTPPCSGVESTYFATVGGKTDLFVGTGAGLFVSSNLGASWTNITYNLNATEVMSIEYANGNLYVATYGQGFLEWPHFT